jgi:putative tricarboxylic transport membrane protein
MEGLLYGLSVAATPVNLLFCFIGAFLGTLVGVLPGIGPVGSMALLLGLTYGLPPTTALIMFAGIYYGSMYGGSTTSILVNIPGEASSVVTAIDGYQMARKGRGGSALCLAAIASFVAGTLGLLLLSFLAPVLANIALRFGPPEYFAIAVLGLFVLSQLSGQGMLKSFVMVCLGLCLGTFGLDDISGQSRFTFGFNDLQKGIDFVPVAMGLFGVAEILDVAARKLHEKQDVIKVRLRELLPNKEETMRSVGPTIRGSLLGFLVGLIPGPAAVIATFVSYTLERRLSKHSAEFGHGAPEGVAGPESANNSAAIGAFVPVLSLGIPFAPPTVLLLSAMLIHGVTPGPLLIQEHPDVFWGVIASMYIGNFILVVLNLPLVGLFVRVLRIPTNLLMPIILLFCVIGVFAINNAVADIWIMLIFGVFGFVLHRWGFSTAPLVLALVIGPMLENSLMQSMMISGGSLSIFYTRPLTRALFILTILTLVLPPLIRLLQRTLFASRMTG